jgi:hypothetical protein
MSESQYAVLFTLFGTSHGTKCVDQNRLTLATTYMADRIGYNVYTYVLAIL